MKRRFRYRRTPFTDWVYIDADRCDVLAGGVLAFGRDDGFVILGVAAGRYVDFEELETAP